MDAIFPDGFDDLRAADMRGVIDEMIHLLVLAGKAPPEMEGGISEALKRREEFGSTVVSNSIAVPHVRHEGIGCGLICAFGRSKKGVHFDNLNQKKTHLFFVVLSSKDQVEKHLECLARISHAVRDENKILEMICEQDVEKLRRLLAEL